MSQSNMEKIDLNDLIGDYIVENVPAFQTYLKQERFIRTK